MVASQGGSDRLRPAGRASASGSEVMRDNLWAPWRMAYMEQLGRQEHADRPAPCFLCEAASCKTGTDAARSRLVLVNDARGLLMLNRYPYTNGHLLAAPVAHRADLPDLDADGRRDLMELAMLGEQVLRRAVNPQGFNVGINIGRCAGAGLPGHLHVHVIPRWSGDTNFIETVGQVRVVPEALEQSFARLEATLKDMGE